MSIDRMVVLLEILLHSGFYKSGIGSPFHETDHDIQHRAEQTALTDKTAVSRVALSHYYSYKRSAVD